MSTQDGLRRRRQPRVVEQEVTETQTVHQSIGWLKAAGISALLTFIVLPLILYLIPAPIQSVAHQLPRPPAWTEALAANKKLEHATRLFSDQIWGPESMVSDKGYLYTGTYDGRIVVIEKGQIREITRFGVKPCGRFENEPTCGRPLGMRMDKDGYLIVADAYLGLFRVNVVTGDHTLLLSPDEPINGKVPKFLNDLDIGPDGIIYLSDSSTKWQRNQFPYILLEGDKTGRLISFNPTTNETKELVTGIGFANGVQLTKDKTAVLLCSSTQAGVFKYYISGSKSGTLETFASNLPIFPDNIRPSSLGGYWIGGAVARKPSFSLLDFILNRVWLSELISKLVSPELYIKFLPKYGLLVHLNQKGEITMTLHDPSGKKIVSVSEVEESGGVLYLGSYSQPFLSKIYMSDIKS